jgi:PKD repeat protein
LGEKIMSQISTILDPIAGEVAQSNVLLTQATADIATIAAAITAGGVGSISPADITELTSVATGMAGLATSIATLAGSLRTLALSLVPVTGTPLVAVSSETPLTGPAPLTVSLTSAGSADPAGGTLTFAWDFGDKTPVDTTPSPTHIYSLAGTYSAVLTVSNGKLSATATPLTITAT